MISALPTTAESGSPPAIDLATVIRSGSTPWCSIAHIFPGAPEAGLHLVDDEDDPVLVADPPHALHELGRRDDEAALAEDRLHHDRGHALGGDLGHERALERLQRRLDVDPAVGVRKRDAVDLRGERAEARLVRVRFRGHRHREEGAAMEGALERDHRRSASCTSART